MAMSTKYLVALISDKCTEVENLIAKLKKQDSKCAQWQDAYLGNLCNLLEMLKSHAATRRDEILKAEGKDPAKFQF